MTSFREYQSRPVTRLAYRITESDAVQALPDCTYVIEIDGEDVSFKAYEPPQAGDYVVYLTDEDIYHCSAAVFRERNVVDD